MYKNVISNTLENGVKIYIVPDNLLDYDYIIKFNNYGSSLDKYLNIYGFQHLLEHAIFYNYNNLNMYINATTSVTDMTINFDIPQKDFNLQKILNHWIFKNNNLVEINLSRNIPNQSVINFINELDNEYEFRSLLYIPWDITTFLLTNGKVHYHGGNNITFSDKINAIKKRLLNPVKIPPQDISIFIKNNKSNIYKDTRRIFSQLKPFKNNIILEYEEKNFYNKSIYLNQGKTNYLVFIHGKDIDLSVLYIINILYPLFNIVHNDIINSYYVSFYFNNINDLFIFYSILKSKNYEELNLENVNLNIKNNIGVLNIDKVPENLSIINETYASLYKKYRKSILNYFQLLSSLISEKKFILSLTKQYLYNNTTPISQEKYYISNTNFLEDYFYSYYTMKFNISNYLSKVNQRNTIFYCKSLIGKSKNLFTEKDEKNNIYFVKYSNTISFTVFIQALLYHFINFYTETLEESIKNIINNNYKYLYKSNSNHDIIFSNKIFHIKTPYNFFFSIFKFYKNDCKNINTTLANLHEYLKLNGICYYIEYNIFQLKKFNIIYISTTINNNKFKRLYNNIINFLRSNNYKLNGNVVFSYKSLELDLSELNKNIKCIF
jgi:hypothetical protein